MYLCRINNVGFRKRTLMFHMVLFHDCGDRWLG
jgi:hypothetical protein